MRNFDALFSDICKAIPTFAELEALSDDEIKRLRNMGRNFDSLIYAEVVRRENEAKNS